MPKKVLALALCRVSSIEQLENNSLNRQRDAVLRAAEERGLTIPDDGWWSGSVSSKKGTNISRKDLQEIIDRCRRDKNVRYLIVDEVDRFMRSMLEMGHFLTIFKTLGVEIVFASQPNLKTDTATNTLLLMLEAFKAEGSNEERQRKSITGQTKALMDGRYTFSPKPGYKRGYERGIQEIHPTRGPALKQVLMRLASHLVTPTQALIELNNSEFMKDHAPYKMDKFRKIATDPFYAGVVEIRKQVSVRNINGLHEPLITLEQHETILKIMNGKSKNQSGPRKNGNPRYPCNNLVSCDNCTDKSNGRLVGFKHTNGKPNSNIYEKYRCRGCGRYWTRDDMHKMVDKHFRIHSITTEGRDDFLEALNIVWKKREAETEQEAARLKHRIKSINETIDHKVDAATDPANASIKDIIINQIAEKKQEVIKLEEQLDKLANQAKSDHEQFLKFAFDFVDNMGRHFLTISHENRERCKQIVFPAGFRLDSHGKVYTPEISPLITLASNKKARTIDVQAHLVQSYRIYLNFLKLSLMTSCRTAQPCRLLAKMGSISSIKQTAAFKLPLVATFALQLE